MDWLSSNNMLMMEQSMRFLWTKQTAILDNIANVETPGYKAKYVTFEETLKARLLSAAHGGQPISEYRNALYESMPVVQETENESMRMDGNNVNAAEQAVELSRNAYQMQFVMQAISSDISTLRTAING